MRIIRNNIIPPKGFKAINICGVIFARKTAVISEQTLRHEYIHTMQMKEMLYVFFYIWYVVEWLIRLIAICDTHKAYRAISFEQEAYENQDIGTYKHFRRHYCWGKYLTKQWKR